MNVELTIPEAALVLAVLRSHDVSEYPNVSRDIRHIIKKIVESIHED